MKTQKGQFIPFPQNHSVTASNRDGKHVTIIPSGLHISFSRREAWIQYAGEQTEDSYTNLEIPSDPEFLKSFAKGLRELAKRIENKDAQ